MLVLVGRSKEIARTGVDLARGKGTGTGVGEAWRFRVLVGVYMGGKEIFGLRVECLRGE